jgi:microcompartment protein CcmK/EutM
MMIATVIGKADASVKAPGLEGRKLLVVRSLGLTGEPEGGLMLAADAIGSGQGDMVAVASGGAALAGAGFAGAILDHVYVENREIIPHRRTNQ